MREVNRKNRKKRRRTSEDNSAPKKGGRKPFHIILIVIYMILMICFSAMLIWLNVLPMKYLIPALAVILIGSFFVVMFLRIRKKRSKRNYCLRYRFILYIQHAGSVFKDKHHRTVHRGLLRYSSGRRCGGCVSQSNGS